MNPDPVERAKSLLKEVDYAKFNWDTPTDPWFLLVLRMESAMKDLLTSIREGG